MLGKPVAHVGQCRPVTARQASPACVGQGTDEIERHHAHGLESDTAVLADGAHPRGDGSACPMGDFRCAGVERQWFVTGLTDDGAGELVLAGHGLVETLDQPGQLGGVLTQRVHAFRAQEQLCGLGALAAVGQRISSSVSS